MATLTDLIARWQSDEGKPYKGRLINYGAYKTDPNNIGCMCAQGQALHLLDGWTAERLLNVGQAEADVAVAKLLNISRAHAVLLRYVNDTCDGAPAIVLIDPGKVLGDQWSKLLDFWWGLDGMTEDQCSVAAGVAWSAAGKAAWSAARSAAGKAVAGVAAAGVDAAGVAAVGVAAGVAAWASNEIQGAEILRREGKPFYFLPAFGFASPDDIPARPADYGVTT